MYVKQSNDKTMKKFLPKKQKSCLRKGKPRRPKPFLICENTKNAKEMIAEAYDFLSFKKKLTCELHTWMAIFDPNRLSFKPITYHGESKQLYIFFLNLVWYFIIYKRPHMAKELTKYFRNRYGGPLNNYSLQVYKSKRAQKKESDQMIDEFITLLIKKYGLRNDILPNDD